MGVSGYTTYMSEHFKLFHRPFELENCRIVIDGNGVAISLYLWYTKSNDRFGGDYDSYAKIVYKFFNLLKQCNVTPIILFDGAYEDRKMEKIIKRLKERIRSIRKLNSSTKKNNKVFPMFTREVFQDIALSLGFKCIRTDYESDSEIGCLARNLQCPILGYDSDFYFFGALYIPFDKFTMRSHKSRKHGNYYIPCQIYNIEYFLKHFRGLNKTNIPLLPVLLGNDYIENKIFIRFFRHLHLVKCKSENAQQVLIHSVIKWLQHETLESAISKIFEYIGEENREFTYIQIKNAMKGYQEARSTVTDYLKDIGITVCKNKKGDNEIENVKRNRDPENLAKALEPTYFVDRYRRCDLPACFANIKWRNTHYCIAQIENYADPNSHRISLEILSSFHKILTSSAKTSFFCVLRCGDDLKEEIVKEYRSNLPSLEDIPNFSKSQCKHYFFEILKIDESFESFLRMFPSNWHVFLISLYYWKKNSKKDIDMTYISSLLLCAIILNFVNPKVGYCRTTKDFEKKIKNSDLHDLKSNKLVVSKSIEKILGNINYDESVLCIKECLSFFSKPHTMNIDESLNEATIVGYFSEFQSCALHIKFLNSLLRFPFEELMFSNFFNGTFLYNTVVDFKRRSDLNCHLENLLKNCDNILHCLNLMISYMKYY